MFFQYLAIFDLYHLSVTYSGKLLHKEGKSAEKLGQMQY